MSLFIKNHSGMMTTSLHLLTDCPHFILIAVSIHPLSLMIDPRAHHHTDAGTILRVSCGPDLIVREGSGAIRVVPLVLTAMSEVCPHTDGEPLIGRIVGILHPVLDTGPLLPGLMNGQPTTKQLALYNSTFVSAEIHKLGIIGRK